MATTENNPCFALVNAERDEMGGNSDADGSEFRGCRGKPGQLLCHLWDGAVKLRFRTQAIKCCNQAIAYKR